MTEITLENKLDILQNIPPASSADIITISTFIKNHFSHRRSDTIRILEAGCGQKSALDLSKINYELTGIDLSQEAIELRKQKFNDLDHAIVGDLVTAKFSKHSFDLIYSSYVLEHVDGAEKALENFCDWLKPNGLMVIRIPDPTTAYSFLAKHLPFWAHVVLKRAMGVKDAGKPGYDPFPTFFDSVVSRVGMHRFCQEHNLKIRLEYSYGYETFRPLYPYAHIALRTLEILSFKRLDANRTDLLFIIEKP